MDALDKDYHNFSTSSSSSHKLPTISGTQAIRNVIQNTRPIPTSLPLLDATLRRSSNFGSESGGLQRGVITEVFGPPGVGKTTFALQVAVNAIHARHGGSCVTWVDTSSQLVPARLKHLSEAYRPPPGRDLPTSSPQPQGSKDSLLTDKFNYLHVASLPKLLALFLHPTPHFPPSETTVVVLDDLSSLILSSLPRPTSSTTGRTSLRSPSTVRDQALARHALSRRFQVLSSFASGLQRFAAANNVAILVTSKATLSLRPGQKAVLRPALTSQQWDNYLSTRIALYRDFWPDEGASTQKNTGMEQQAPTEVERKTLRLAKVMRLDGKLVSGPEVGFVIEQGGLREILTNVGERDKSVLPLATQPLPALEDVLEPSMNHDNDDPASQLDNDELLKGGNDGDDARSEASRAAKRKAIEIADSEDEEDVFDISDDEPSRLPPNATKGNDFQPSSQILHTSQNDRQRVFSETTATRQPTKTMKDDELHGSPDLPPNTRHDVDQEEMLLETYEVQAPPFSQAAAEMSEPLTPSDDGRDLS